MLDKLFPHEHVKSLEDVDYERLLRAGYRYFFFDYDFTLAPWGELRIEERVKRIFEFLRENGAQVFVVTNAKKKRVDHLKNEIPWLEIRWNVGKPSVKKLKKLMEEKGIDPKKSVIIGDLFFTDILAGNKLGMYTIMVNPIAFEAMKIWKKVVAFLSMLLYRIVFFAFGWIFRTASLISPNEWRGSIKDVNYESLLNAGFKLFIFDFDNTLAPWKSSVVSEENLEILKNLSERAFVLIASNGRPRDVELPVEIIWRSYKPLGFKVRKRIREIGVDFKRVVVVGDQLFTDVLFGNLIGAYTVKVEPISKEEALITKMNRFFEKFFSKLIVEKPSLTSKDR